MTVLGSSAPYDSLEDVAQLARTYLADYIAGIDPHVDGVVNINGTDVVWVSGDKFSYLFRGMTIVVSGLPYEIAVVNGPTSATLATSAGVQAAVQYVGTIPTGDIFSDAQAYTLDTINAAWRRFQKKLADKGNARLQGRIIIPNIPVVGDVTDPSIECWLDWTGFSDGVNAPRITPFLPPDLISPTAVWERPAGSDAPFPELPNMALAGDSLRTQVKTMRNRQWEWRADKLYFPGTTVSVDFKITYNAFLPLIVPNAQGWAYTPLPIMQCAESVAYYAAAIFVTPRGGGALASTYSAAGDEATDVITKQGAKTQSRTSFHRKAWGERGRRRGGITGF